MKPAASSCGRGIRVISKNQHLKKRSGYVLCKYVSKPHLLNGYKYDLRLYVLVTSFEPLKIYLFREGLVRCATTPYSTSKASLKQRFVHLTNYSVNKKADAYVKNVNANVAAETQGASVEGEAEGGGDAPVESKLNLNQLRKEYAKMGVDYDQVFTGI
jgi:tubulin polyglutamylase TTLL4